MSKHPKYNGFTYIGLSTLVMIKATWIVVLMKKCTRYYLFESVTAALYTIIRRT